VRDVRVERQGGGLIEAEAVLAFTSVKVGDELSRVALSRDVRALEKSGRFAYVATRLDEVPGGVAVIYQVRGKPRIHMIRVEGADDVGNRKVREWLELGPGDLVDDATLAFKGLKVREQYAKKYYPYTKLNWTIAEDAANGTADVTIRVVEGKRALVKRIVFEGDVEDPGRGKRILRALFPWAFDWPPYVGHDLRRVMRQRQSTMWSWLSGSGAYKPEDLDGDAELVRRVLQDRGFLDARVGQPDIKALGPRRLEVRVPVQSGSQYQIGSIELKGVTLFPAADVSRVITNQPGDVASLSAIERVQQAVGDYYGSRGYIGSDARYQLNPRPGKPVVDLDLNP
jgi:outer membrane protein insertion porin family